MPRVNTPKQNVHKQLFYTGENEVQDREMENINESENSSDEEMILSENTPVSVTVDYDELKPLVEQLKTLLPQVTKHLADNNCIEEWYYF